MGAPRTRSRCAEGAFRLAAAGSLARSLAAVATGSVLRKLPLGTRRRAVRTFVTPSAPLRSPPSHGRGEDPGRSVERRRGLELGSAGDCPLPVRVLIPRSLDLQVLTKVPGPQFPISQSAKIPEIQTLRYLASRSPIKSPVSQNPRTLRTLAPVPQPCSFQAAGHAMKSREAFLLPSQE